MAAVKNPRPVLGIVEGFGLYNNGKEWLIEPMPTDEYAHRPMEFNGFAVSHWSHIKEDLETLQKRFSE